MPNVVERLDERLNEARARLSTLVIEPERREVGVVDSVGSGIASIVGLPSARLDELLVLPDDTHALAVTLDADRIGAVLLDRAESIVAGVEVRGSGEVLRVPVGDPLLGRVIDPLGRPLDGGAPVIGVRRDEVERPAPAIIDRELVTEPLHTGVLVVDSMVPLGRGQRELIIGDRATGKTSLALDTMLSQRTTDVVSVYCAIGQKASAVGRLIEEVRERGAFERSVFVVAEADDPPGLQWVAPYAACTMAEYFRDRGGHALLVIDDLSKHAIVHRELSLLLRNPPGREAYPGDVFYLHSRLLERAAKLSKDGGGGSLTALAIAETQSGNLSAYIPTNLISITDGQIYLESKLFHEGQKPAVNVGKSVSRVGGKTQPAAIRGLSGRLRLDYSQFLELEVFARFGQVLDPRTARSLEQGRRIRAILEQPQSEPRSLAAEVALLLALHEGVLDVLSLDAVQRFKTGIEDGLRADVGEVARRIEATGRLEDDARRRLVDWLTARAAALRPVEE
ncbi:MAG TPA: F0F1 ATP synthase subunit alpha [Polyangiaceae bacterium]|nr:F0F1 ATP synthase subunit alpha [Polyangiaceae bacterium]